MRAERERAGASGGGRSAPEQDRVDVIIEQWRRERPELDPSSKGITARLVRAGDRVSALLTERAFAPAGLSEADYGILVALRRAGAPFTLTPTELSRSQMVTSGGMTSMVDRLERRGWVERVRNPNDRRGVLVRLTPEGRELVDRAMLLHNRAEHELVAGLSPREREQLASLLRRFLVSIEGPASPDQPR